MSTDTVLDRLQVLNAEISGIVRAFRLQPTKSILPAEYPYAYARPLGMTQPTPRPSAGQYLVSRRFLVRIVVARSGVASIDNADEGAKLLNNAVPYLDRVTDLYMTRPRLENVSRQALTTVAEDISIQDSGPVIVKESDGTDVVIVDHILTITERRIPSPARLS